MSAKRTLDNEGVCTRCGVPDVHCFCPDLDPKPYTFTEARAQLAAKLEFVKASICDGLHLHKRAARHRVTACGYDAIRWKLRDEVEEIRHEVERERGQ